MDGFHIILLVLYLVYLFSGLYYLIKNKSAAIPLKKRICNDIEKQTSGGNCEAFYSMPPAVSKEMQRLSNENYEKAKIALTKLNNKLINQSLKRNNENHR